MSRYAACVGVLFTLLCSACQVSDRAQPTLESVQEEARPDQESWDVALTIDDEGTPRMQLEAAYMARYESRDSTYMRFEADSDTARTRIRATLYDTQGDSSAVLIADRAWFYERERRFDARGRVVVTTTDNKRLETEHLIWFDSDRTISSPGFVRIETPDERIQGYELEADEDLETYTIARVTGQVTIRE